ncbi:ABC transporter substrate-binding protein [Nonomuraea basaltis]|uniref:ABC transporter substrate-binding protein n=1 Tax=Nonomuraea basaltis TaxID=2495887 RepID=UPI00110C6679|nr:ABC transporter substrate-binding protein [Nonomuraea basaltis]TMR97121.1 ABC transporter substrate-binding protein [Nonomuraea basaltis]
MRRAVLAVLAALVLAATGCAQRSSTTPPGVLNVGQISNSIAFFPLFVAEQKGYFTEEGVKLGERPRLGTGAKVAAALKSGSIDLGAGVLTDALNLARIDDKGRLVANLVDRYYVDVVVGSSFTGATATAPLDQRIRALRGKKIGITGPGSGTEALVTYLFAKVGMNSATDCELVNLGSTAASALGALKAGRVDALSFFQPIAQQAAAAGIGTRYISPAAGDVPDLEQTAHGVVFTTQRIMDKKPEEVAAFQRALERAQRYIHETDSAEITKMLAVYLKGIDPKALTELPGLMRTEIPEKIGFTRTSFDRAIAFHRATDLVKHLPTYEKIVPPTLRIEAPPPGS